jgi:hypothetical protein
MGRYSNHCDQGERLRSLLAIVPSCSQNVGTRSRKHVCRRLRPPEIEELIAGYKAGAPIKALVARFKIDESTVTQHVKRAGVRLRVPALLPKEVERLLGFISPANHYDRSVVISGCEVRRFGQLYSERA